MKVVEGQNWIDSARDRRRVHADGRAEGPDRLVLAHVIPLQAKGARWVIVGMGGATGLASGLVAKLIP